MAPTGGVSNSSSAGRINRKLTQNHNKVRKKNIGSAFQNAQKSLNDTGNSKAGWRNKFIQHQHAKSLAEKPDVQKGSSYGDSLAQKPTSNQDISNAGAEIIKNITDLFSGGG